MITNKLLVLSLWCLFILCVQEVEREREAKRKLEKMVFSLSQEMQRLKEVQ